MGGAKTTQNSADTWPCGPVNNANRLAIEHGIGRLRRLRFGASTSDERVEIARPRPALGPHPLEVILSDRSLSDAGAPYMDFYPDWSLPSRFLGCPRLTHAREKALANNLKLLNEIRWDRPYLQRGLPRQAKFWHRVICNRPHFAGRSRCPSPSAVCTARLADPNCRLKLGCYHYIYK